MRTLAWTNFLRNWGNLAKSLTLKGLIPDAECLVWMRRLLCVWCRNVAELTLEFSDREECRRMSQQSVLQDLKDFRQYLADGDEVNFEQSWMPKKNHAFAPYPALHNIRSLRVSKISDPVTTFFSINVLLAVPNLKRLFISEQSVCEPKLLMNVLSRRDSLKHLDWTISIPVHLYEILAEDGQMKIPSLEFCHLRVPYLVCPLNPKNAVEMVQFQAKKAQILEMLLKTKQSACKFVVTTTDHQCQHFCDGEERTIPSPSLRLDVESFSAPFHHHQSSSHRIPRLTGRRASFEAFSQILRKLN
jgi:hypothetical protein